MSENEPDSNGQRGCIINTSHMAAEEGIMGHVPYSATKGAINSMTLPLSRDLASLGVRVNTVQLGNKYSIIYLKNLTRGPDGPISSI